MQVCLPLTKRNKFGDWVDAAANAGLNALMIQVRPEGDALMNPTSSLGAAF